MKRFACGLISVAIVGSQVTGCATTQEPSNTAKGVGIGAVAGGALGALLGGSRGAAIGAAAGAVLGGVAGNYYDKQSATRAEAERKYGSQVAGDRLEIEKSSLTPQAVTLGTPVDSVVEYTALSSQTDAPIKVTEVRSLVGPTDTVELAKREVTRAQGTHTSQLRFTMPKDIAKGDYMLITTITDGKQTKTARNPFRIV
jgi:hypothetical protein